MFPVYFLTLSFLTKVVRLHGDSLSNFEYEISLHFGGKKDLHRIVTESDLQR